MSSAQKLLAHMRRNPRGDFRVEDFKTVCNSLREQGVQFLPPSKGSHFKVAFPDGTILVIPARKPIKPVYVRHFVELVDTIIGLEGQE
jgi:predicted RNA binding protein YcfA (HicA-like mRNA interferase family)